MKHRSLVAPSLVDSGVEMIRFRTTLSRRRRRLPPGGQSVAHHPGNGGCKGMPSSYAAIGRGPEKQLKELEK
jgi:hypothetical protein